MAKHRVDGIMCENGLWALHACRPSGSPDASREDDQRDTAVRIDPQATFIKVEVNAVTPEV